MASEHGTLAPAPDIGQVASPPFAILPDPASIFRHRSQRFAALADGHQLSPYLEFLAALSGIQHTIQAGLGQPDLPAPAILAQAYEYGMPPISVGNFKPEGMAGETLECLIQALWGLSLPEQTRAALDRLAKAGTAAREAMMLAVLLGSVEEEALAEHVLVAASLQVHFSRLAAKLNADQLKPVADAACPSCGGAPMSSAVVGWPGAQGSRFCQCSLCATQWNVVRIKCLNCGTDKGIAYYGVEGGIEEVKAESCESCGSYVKIFHMHKAPHLDPLADDVASLGLDIMMRDKGWKRCGANPFLLGY